MSTLQQIRARKSYRMFKNIYRAMQQGNIEQALLQIHEELDKRSAYGAQSRADWAKESAQQVIEDFKNELHEQEEQYPH